MKVIFTLGLSTIEIFATNILAHSAYLIYCCHHLKSKLSRKESKFLYRCYTTYAAFALTLLFFVTIAYDWKTGNGKYTILASGHCIYLDHPSYNTLLFTTFVAVVNKILQITMFSTYLVYYYKFNLNVCAAQVSLEQSQKLFRIATAMGGTIGLSFFIFALVVFIPEYSITFIMGGILFFF